MKEQPNTVRYCRKCDEALTWDKKRNRWAQCRNGCSQVTAALPSDIETALTCGSDEEGRNVRGSAYRRYARHDG